MVWKSGNTAMFIRFFNQYRVDLHDMEGDYRAFNLQSDKAQAVLSLLVTSFSIPSAGSSRCSVPVVQSKAASTFCRNLCQSAGAG